MIYNIHMPKCSFYTIVEVKLPDKSGGECSTFRLSTYEGTIFLRQVEAPAGGLSRTVSHAVAGTTLPQVTVRPPVFHTKASYFGFTSIINKRVADIVCPSEEWTRFYAAKESHQKGDCRRGINKKIWRVWIILGGLN